MIIRCLNENDVGEYNKVSSSAFIWKVDPEIDNKLPDDACVLGAFSDDNKTLMALAECLDFKNYFGRGMLGCVGIGGVATKPEYRRMGGVRRIFSEVERLSSERGWDIGILYPFSTEYYRLFGYENVALYASAKVPFRCLSHIERNCSVDLLEQDKLDDMLALYNNIALKTNLCFRRETGKYFSTEPYKTAVYTYMWKNAEGEYRSYATYSVNRDEKTVQVNEIGFQDRESLCGILGFLRCYDGNQEYINFGKLPINSPVFEMLPETAHLERHLGNMGAVRIYNVGKVLDTKLYPEEHGSFSLLIEDSHKPNAGIYDIEYEKGTAKVTKRSGGNADISLSAAAAARLLISGVSGGFEALGYMNGVKVFNGNNDFLRAFPAVDTFFNDGF
jgi:predicted acetyltransferase